MKIKEQIKYFKGVRAQHKAIAELQPLMAEKNIRIIRTYDFVIEKLEEWSKK